MAKPNQWSVTDKRRRQIKARQSKGPRHRVAKIDGDAIGVPRNVVRIRVRSMGDPQKVRIEFTVEEKTAE